MEETQNINQEEKSLPPSLSEGEEKKKKMSLWKKIVWGIVVLIILVIAVQVLIADKYKATVLVIEGEKKVGVNPTSESLDFGDLSHDTATTRIITLKSSGSRDTYVYIMKFGGLSDLMKIDDNKIILKGGEERKVEFSVYMPVSAPIGKRMDAYVWIFKAPKIW